MEMQKVISSNITEVGFESLAESIIADGGELVPVGMLTVAFKTGNAYKYDKVPEKVHAGFMASESKGKFFAQNIRAKYKATKVEKEEVKK